MPSFLVTSKMNPALRARVLRSLEGDAATRLKTSGRKLAGRGLLRLALLAGILALVAVLVVTFRKSRQEFARVRTELLLEFERLADHEATQLRKPRESAVEVILEAASRQQPEVRALESQVDLDRQLARPLLYVRGSLPDLATEPSLRDVADEAPDAFALCLTHPPDQTREAPLLRHLGRARLESNIRTLGEVFDLESFVGSSFARELAGAEHMSQLRHLERRLKRRTKDFGSLTAEVLLYVIDEPLASGELSDFDGEGKHHLRIGLVELPSGTVLLRSRREVSPDWISDKSRLSFSRPLDSCKVAFDLRSELASPKLELFGD